MREERNITTKAFAGFYADDRVASGPVWREGVTIVVATSTFDDDNNLVGEPTVETFNSEPAGRVPDFTETSRADIIADSRALVAASADADAAVVAEQAKVATNRHAKIVEDLKAGNFEAVATALTGFDPKSNTNQGQGNDK